MAAKIDSITVDGIKVPFIYEKDTRLPLTNTQIIFTNAGSIKNTQIAGLSSVSAKVLNEGTKKLGSNAFAEALESKAISISAHSGTETFVMEMSALKDQYDNGMDYFETLLKDPNYSNESISKIKTMTLGSLSRKENDFDYVASNKLKNILFDGGVLGQPASGTKESINRIQLSDV
ncbi:MAG: insulinase family protein, partial [Campylobacterota bacterium]|nr:insulinase family protein [Campylobacterota bacterium]